MQAKKHTIRRLWPNYLQNVFFVVTAALLTVGLFYNIAAVSQLTPFYAKVTSSDNDSVVYFFKQAKSLSDFYSLLHQIRQTFKLYENQVFAEERRRQDHIKKLEQLLQQNPNSRDILYSLSVLYKREGLRSKAAEYLQKAREIDPQAGKQQVESSK